MKHSKTAKSRAPRSPKAAPAPAGKAPAQTPRRRRNGAQTPSDRLPAPAPAGAPAADNGPAMVLKVPGHVTAEVATIEQAQAAYVTARKAAILGPDEFPRGEIYVGGTLAMHVCYNGRVVDLADALLLDAPPGSFGIPAEPLPDASIATIESKFLHAALTIAAKKDTRYYLNGVHFQPRGRELRISATDGHRLLIASVPIENEVAWPEDGVILRRDELERVARFVGQRAIAIGFGLGHPTVSIEEAAGFARFTLTPVDGKFPPLDNVIGQAGEIMAAQREPADTSAVQGAYLKSAGIVAAQLGAGAVFPFIGARDTQPCAFTFDKCPGALLVIMPTRADSRACIAPETLRLIGAAGMAATVTALKAHETRTRKALDAATSEDEKDQLKARLKGFRERIETIRAATTPALAAPAAAAPVEETPTPAPAPRKRGGRRSKRPGGHA